MPKSWVISFTVSDRDVPAETVEKYLASVLEGRTGTTTEKWKAHGVHYWRTIYFREAYSVGQLLAEILAEAVPKMQEHGINHMKDRPTVAFAVREASFSAVDAMPPTLRRAIKGGRPPKNPPTGT